jgi:hypothetical protein
MLFLVSSQALYAKLTYVHHVNVCSIAAFFAEVAEAKFKEVMDSYEAIKLERGNGSC